ncbi:SHOCT domain-containing protein [Ureibacillus acetophenoni]|uniref:Putative oligomerization/nucleic acid binding protein n=1 Tax=Ureibacillus acetophenoni TaxID=614649 RepID=A0A285UNS0_9BACL|nr:SHOCT domain-containing protein [Ureibacillus acetophenoni]SOC43413.1 putative oligomerization/nucleic acid binding protein [Ureibacillus acetophenoni]
MGCLAFILALFMLFIIMWLFTVSPILGIIVTVGLIWGGIYLGKIETQNKTNEINNKKNTLDTMQNLQKDFTVSQKYQSYDLESTILLDEERKKVCFLFAKNNTTEIYDYKDILESEIIEDGKTITSTSRSSQLGGAIIGGVLAGGTGAVIGGLSGKKTSEQEINKIDLKVIVNNTKNPIKIINFLKADKVDINGKALPIKKESSNYVNAINSINHWHSLLSILIKQSDSIDSKESEEKVISNNVNISTADELKKLADLRNSGILTDEEFQQQKQKVLNR